MAYSFVQYVQSDGTTERAVPFPYIQKTHVKVYLDGVLKTETTDYIWLNDNTIDINVTPTIGTVIDIRRETSRNTRLINFQDAAILTEVDLDNDSIQGFYLAQEAFDAADNSIQLGLTGNFDAENKQIINVADPTSAQDAMTKAYADANYGAVTATINDGAVTTAKLADGSVTSTKIANSSVTTTKLVDASVTTVKIADANVTTSKIADSNVTTAKIADANVTLAKLAAAVAEQLTGHQAPRVVGLVGGNNSVSPNTKFDLSARGVTAYRSAGDSVFGWNISTLTNDTGAAGPAANGRDQSAAFGNSTWIHLYFIYNGSTWATLSSLTAPPTGPTLPTGYTHWCYATTIRKDSGGNLKTVSIAGNYVGYLVDETTTNRALSIGTSTTYAAVDLSSFIPVSVTRRVQLNNELQLLHNTANIGFRTFLRTTGQTAHILTGAAVMCIVANNWCAGNTEISMLTDASGSIDYKISTSISTSGGVFLDVRGYFVPNGDS